MATIGRRRILGWAARGVGVAIALLLAILSLDSIQETEGFWLSTLSLLLHLIPTYLVLIALAVAWYRPRVGAMMFIALGVAYVIAVWPHFSWAATLTISGPLVLAGLLFLASRSTEQQAGS